MIDLLRYFLGEFSDAKSFVERSYWKESSVEDNAFALKTKRNQVAMLHSSRHNGSTNSVWISI